MQRRKPGPRRIACPWCGSTNCTHCHCDGYAGCDHSQGTACSRARYKRRLVCNRCEKHKLKHAKNMYNCTPKQLERHAMRLQQACANGRHPKTKPTMVVKLQTQSRVRRFQLSAPLKSSSLRQLIGAAYGYAPDTFEIQYKCSGQAPRPITGDDSLRKATLHWSEHNPGRHFRLHLLRHDQLMRGVSQPREVSSANTAGYRQPRPRFAPRIKMEPRRESRDFAPRATSGRRPNLDAPTGLFGGEMMRADRGDWSADFSAPAATLPPSPPRLGGFGGRSASAPLGGHVAKRFESSQELDAWPRSEWGALPPYDQHFMANDGHEQTSDSRGLDKGLEDFLPLYGPIDDDNALPMLDEMTRAFFEQGSTPIFNVMSQARVLDLGPLPPEATKEADKKQPGDEALGGQDGSASSVATAVREVMAV